MEVCQRVAKQLYHISIMTSNDKQQKSIQSENFHYAGLEIILLLHHCKAIPEMFLYTSVTNPMIITLQQHSACELEFNFLFFLKILSIKGHLLGLN